MNCTRVLHNLARRRNARITGTLTRKTSTTIQQPIEKQFAANSTSKRLVESSTCSAFPSTRYPSGIIFRCTSLPDHAAKTKQDISQQHQIEVRQLHQRRAQIRILKLAHGTNLRTHLRLLLTSNHVFQKHTRRQPAVNLQPSVSSLSAHSSIPDQIRDDHIAQRHESSINSVVAPRRFKNADRYNRGASRIFCSIRNSVINKRPTRPLPSRNRCTASNW
jgi:hypothetical protein